MIESIESQIVKEVNNLILDIIFFQETDSNFDVIVDDVRYIDKTIKIINPLDNIKVDFIIE